MQIFLLDKNNNAKAESNLKKPKSYQDLLSLLKQKITNMSEYFEIFIIDQNNNEIKIDNEQNYSMIGDILFIREINKVDLEQSLFQRNFNELSESKKDILGDKFNCLLCSEMIKNEKPYLCYQCQKIFHEKCLTSWERNVKRIIKF